MKFPKCFARGALSALCLFAPAVRADVIYNLTLGRCPNTCRFEPIVVGTVDLHQVDTTEVQVTVTLAGGSGEESYSDDALARSLDFNIEDDPAISISNLTLGFTAGPAPGGGGELGRFDYSVEPTGWGYRDGMTGPLVFDVSDGSALSIDDFTANGRGLYFAAGIGWPWGPVEYAVADMAATDPPSPTAEPSGAALLSGGLGWLWYARRRRRTRSLI